MKFFWFRLSFQLFFFIGWRALRALRSPLPIELRIHPGNRALGPRADRSKNDGGRGKTSSIQAAIKTPAPPFNIDPAPAAYPYAPRPPSFRDREACGQEARFQG